MSSANPRRTQPLSTSTWPVERQQLLQGRLAMADRHLTGRHCIGLESEAGTDHGRATLPGLEG